MVQFYKIPTILSIVWLSFSTAYQSNHNQTKVCNVTVIYETLCIYSRNFMADQVQQAYKALKNQFIFNPIPYGAAQTIKKNGTLTFTCQHGPQECTGNKIQACALYACNKNTEQMVDVVTNFMTKPPPFSKNYSQYFTIGDKGKLKQFLDCMNSNKGNEILAKYGDATVKARPTGIPYVIINGIGIG